MAIPVFDKIELVRISDEQPGIFRKKKGKGFCFYSPDGGLIREKELCKRIQKLVIPPNWKSVWISPLENSHIQVTGRDEKGRKQYIYHPHFVARQQNMKFDKLLSFAGKLPLIRQTTEEDLQQTEWTKRKVIALIIQIMDHCPLRIGNQYYERHNKSYGLTTLRRKHMTFTSNEIVFSFKAKSNVYRKVSICHPRLTKLIRECAELPGHEVFRYYDENKKTHPITSGDVNQYLYELTQTPISCKDFRTWAGTTLAVRFYPEALREASKNRKISILNAVIRKVSDTLGNTVSICRNYYIHPKVKRAIERKDIPAIPQSPRENNSCFEDYERIALDILRREEPADPFEATLEMLKKKSRKKRKKK